MKLFEYASYDGIGLAGLVKKGLVTSRELVELAYEAIDLIDPHLNFLVEDTREEAEKTLSQDLSRGPFEGVPFLIKDIGAPVAGVPMEMGSRLAKGFIPDTDCELVKRFRTAGIVIVGRSTTPEFGNSVTTEPVTTGPTRNPWNIEHITGGSSGGAAAAVAAKVVPIAHASDGGGSIRTPASCCGLFGFKPSRGRTPMGTDATAGIFGLGVGHVLSRSVRDSAAMLDSISGIDPGSLYQAPQTARSYLTEVSKRPNELHVALINESTFHGKPHPDVIRVLHEAVNLCADLGHKVSETELPYTWDEFYDAFKIVWCFGVPYRIDGIASNTGLKPGPETIETANLACYEFGLTITSHELMFAIDKLCGFTRSMQGFLEDYDVILSPVNSSPPPRLGTLLTNTPDINVDTFLRTHLSFCPFTAIYNVTGQPAMSLPCGMSSEGLPIGVQFAGSFFDESTLFRLAGQIEETHSWRSITPPVAAKLLNGLTICVDGDLKPRDSGDRRGLITD